MEESWSEKANELLFKVFSEIYPDSFRNNSLPQIEVQNLSVSLEEVYLDFKPCFYNDFEYMIIDDIPQAINLLKEIYFIITKFHVYTSNIVSILLLLFIFLDAFPSAIGGTTHQIGNGQILYRKRISLEGFS
jgi:hypothetical protein